jgi:hypothetical protein
MQFASDADQEKANPDEEKKATKKSFFQSIKMSLGKVKVEEPEKITLKQVENQSIEFLEELAMSYNFEKEE